VYSTVRLLLATKRLLRVLAVVGVLVAACMAGAHVRQQTLYADPEGACGASRDGSAPRQWPTIAHAGDARGDVVLASGRYNGSGNVNLTIASTSSVTIRSATGKPEDVLLDCDGHGWALLIQNTGQVAL